MKTLVIVFLLSIGLIQQTRAQAIPELRIVENGSIQETEFVASIIRDVNGSIAAGLIIESDLIGLAYESNNGIIKRDIKPGRDFLFLSPEERVVTVYKSGYKPLKIFLLENGVHLKSGMVHKISITADKKLAEIPINILTNPNNATIKIANKIIESGSTLTLLEGKYGIEIELEGYDSIKDSILVVPDKTLFTYDLQKREFVKLSINTIPNQATVFIENENVGLTDLSVLKKTGKYAIRISKAGFTELIDTLLIEKNKENTFTFNLNANEGTLNLNIQPQNATINLSGQVFTGKSKFSIKAGMYQLIVSADGYKSFSEIFEIKKNEVIQKEIKLVPLYGSLQVTLAQKQAKVSIFQNNGDFALAWEGDRYISELPVGDYTIAIQLPNYFPIQKQFRVDEGQTTADYYEFKQSMLVSQPLPPQNKDGALYLYAIKPNFDFKNTTYRSLIKENTNYGFGLGLESSNSIINLSFMKSQPKFRTTPTTNLGEKEFIVMMGDINLKFDLFKMFQPFGGVGYTMTTLDGRLKRALLNTNNTTVYHAPYYHYGCWVVIGDVGEYTINLGVGYDVKKSFSAKEEFESKGWMASVVIKF